MLKYFPEGSFDNPYAVVGDFLDEYIMTHEDYGWNDAMNYIFRDGEGYRPFSRDKKYESEETMQ